MKSFLNSSVPLQYLTTPPTKKVVRLQKCPLDIEIRTVMMLAACAHKDEVCGFVTEDENVIWVPNSHVEPHYNFYMDIEHIQEALDVNRKVYQDRDIIGIFHTHHNNLPWPTPVDIAGWPNPTLQWRYWIATQHEVIEWAKVK